MLSRSQWATLYQLVDGRLHCNSEDDEDDDDDDDKDDDVYGLNELLSDEEMLTHLKVSFWRLVNEILTSKQCKSFTLNSILFSFNVLCLKRILLVAEFPDKIKFN